MALFGFNGKKFGNVAFYLFFTSKLEKHKGQKERKIERESARGTKGKMEIKSIKLRGSILKMPSNRVQLKLQSRRDNKKKTKQI